MCDVLRIRGKYLGSMWHPYLFPFPVGWLNSQTQVQYQNGTLIHVISRPTPKNLAYINVILLLQYSFKKYSVDIYRKYNLESFYTLLSSLVLHLSAFPLFSDISDEYCAYSTVHCVIKQRYY
ncbi:hypothetical protein GDO81_004435 [Engystomops pustulosus]|uniref:Uncharacterized protein n=1 Tax=Engystomops pustulosus TaxID=76066 RepID=A0AAV7A1K5_ENGPU|nr:hypothetical protein GDO81_004435 [Engystomops pustulosus]